VRTRLVLPAVIAVAGLTLGACSSSDDHDGMNSTDTTMDGMGSMGTDDAQGSTTTLDIPDGAEFNVKLLGEGRYGKGDKSLGVHNPFLAKGLLADNIAELQATYPGLHTIGLREQAADESALNSARLRVTGSRMSHSRDSVVHVHRDRASLRPSSA